VLVRNGSAASCPTERWSVRSAGTRSWEQAERNVRKKEAEAGSTRVDQVQLRRTTVKDAIRMFLEDEEARVSRRTNSSFARSEL